MFNQNGFWEFLLQRKQLVDDVEWLGPGVQLLWNHTRILMTASRWNKHINLKQAWPRWGDDLLWHENGEGVTRLAFGDAIKLWSISTLVDTVSLWSWSTSGRGFWEELLFIYNWKWIPGYRTRTVKNEKYLRRKFEKDRTISQKKRRNAHLCIYSASKTVKSQQAVSVMNSRELGAVTRSRSNMEMTYSVGL